MRARVCMCVRVWLRAGVSVFMGVNACEYVSTCVTVRVCQQRVTGCECGHARVHVCACVAVGGCEGVNALMHVNACEYVSVCVTVRVC